jgi:putative DNA primase/helicase
MTPEAYTAISAACANLGISPPPIDAVVFDGKIHRYHDPLHDKPSERNGWVKSCDNGDGSFGGTVGHWRLGIKANWSSRSKRKFTPEERAAYARQMLLERQREAEERERQYLRISEKAANLWRISSPASRNHPYLLRKRIEAHGIRQIAKQLVIPIRDTAGTLWTLQYVDSSGDKRFLSGGRTKGCYWSVGSQPVETILVAEGMATAATLFEATRLPVAAAMNAGNMLPVSLALHEKYPAVLLLICADADPVGRASAAEAAEAVGGTVIEPDFSGEDNG